MPEDMPDKVPECLPDRRPEDLPDNMPEDMPDRMPDRMLEDMPEHMPEDMPGRMPEDMPDRMPEGMPDKVPECLPDRMPEDLPNNMPEDMPDSMPDRMPEDMPDRMPEDMPDRIPEGMPDKVPECLPDRMPEDLPVTKCINVMVGITRSKVICFSQWLQLYSACVPSARWPTSNACLRMKSKLNSVITTMADLGSQMEKTFSTGVVEGFDAKWETQSFPILLFASALSLVTLLGTHSFPGWKKLWKPWSTNARRSVILKVFWLNLSHTWTLLSF